MKQVLLATLLATSTLYAVEETTAPLDISLGELSGSVGVYSEYLFRGLKQTAGDPALQANIDYTLDNGLYVGAWISNTKWTEDGGYMNNNDVETNIYAGYADTFGDTGIGYDVGVLQYWFPGNTTNGQSGTDTTELYAGVNKDVFGTNIALKYSHAITEDVFGIGNASGSDYTEVNWTVPVTEQLTAIAHVGRSTFDGLGNGVYDYTDSKVSLEYAYTDAVTVGAGYSMTNASEANWTIKNEYLGESQALAWLTYSF